MVYLSTAALLDQSAALSIPPMVDLSHVLRFDSAPLVKVDNAPIDSGAKPEVSDSRTLNRRDISLKLFGTSFRAIRHRYTWRRDTRLRLTISVGGDDPAIVFFGLMKDSDLKSITERPHNRREYPSVCFILTAPEDFIHPDDNIRRALPDMDPEVSAMISRYVAAPYVHRSRSIDFFPYTFQGRGEYDYLLFGAIRQNPKSWVDMFNVTINNDFTIFPSTEVTVVSPVGNDTAEGIALSGGIELQQFKGNRRVKMSLDRTPKYGDTYTVTSHTQLGFNLYSLSHQLIAPSKLAVGLIPKWVDDGDVEEENKYLIQFLGRSGLVDNLSRAYDYVKQHNPDRYTYPYQGRYQPIVYDSPTGYPNTFPTATNVAHEIQLWKNLEYFHLKNDRGFPPTCDRLILVAETPTDSEILRFTDIRIFDKTPWL